jgi:hypothetical protein
VNRTVQARLDEESMKALRRLVRRLGLRPSEIVRRSLHLLDRAESGGTTRIIGLGEFESDVRDLGSNKDHLRGFGK